MRNNRRRPMSLLTALVSSVHSTALHSALRTSSSAPWVSSALLCTGAEHARARSGPGSNSHTPQPHQQVQHQNLQSPTPKLHAAGRRNVLRILLQYTSTVRSFSLTELQCKPASTKQRTQTAHGTERCCVQVQRRRHHPACSSTSILPVLPSH